MGFILLAKQSRKALLLGDLPLSQVMGLDSVSESFAPLLEYHHRRRPHHHHLHTPDPLPVSCCVVL